MVFLHLPDYREETHPLDVVGLILFGSGIALLSYVLEIFGEHALSTGEVTGLLVISLALLAGYGIHAKSIPFPLLQLRLFSIRTFRAAVSGSFFTRLGIGGVPFLLPLLYQVGLGLTPIQSGLLITPQAVAAMTMKLFLQQLLTRFGYRGVLVSNTVILGILILLFATIGLHTPIWANRAAGIFVRGLHVAAIYQHEHAGLCRRHGGETSGASSIAATGAADGDQLWRRTCGARHGVLRARFALQSRGDDSRDTQGIFLSGRADHRLFPCLPWVEARRWRQREPAKDVSPGGVIHPQALQHSNLLMEAHSLLHLLVDAACGMAT